MFSNAHKLAVLEHGSTKNWGFTKTTTDEDKNISDNQFTNMHIFWDKLLPYMKYVSYCRTDDNTCNSLAEQMYFLDGSPKKSYNNFILLSQMMTKYCRRVYQISEILKIFAT